MKKILKHTAMLISTAILLSACGGVDVQPVDNRTKAQKQRDEKGSLFGLSDSLSGKKKDLGSVIGVNAHLWRGALDTLSVNPLEKIDATNGVIQTEWVSVNSTEQVRISALIISAEFNLTALRVNVYKRVKQDGAWVNLKVDRETTDAISDAILQRARELRLEDEK